MPNDMIRRLREDADDNNQPPRADIHEHIIPQGVEYPKPDAVFEISGVPVFTKKSISTLIGKAKSGKTTVTAWLIAQCIRGGMTVLWVDTEQGRYYGSRTQYWVLSIAGLSLYPDFKYLDVKTLKPTERADIITAAISEFNPDVIVIDGIRDLIYDINDPKESTIISGQMMKWAEEHDTHVLSILHQNKGNEHARGHLGAELVNKSETVIAVELDDNRNVVCKPEFTRSEPFMPFAFTRDGYGIPVLIEGYIGNVEVTTGRRSVKPTDYTIEEHKEYLRVAFRGSEKLSYGELLGAVSASFGLHGVTIGEKKTKAFISHFILIGILKTNKNGKYTYYYISE